MAAVARGSGSLVARLAQLAAVAVPGCYALVLTAAFTFQRRLLFFPDRRRVWSAAELVSMYPQYAGLEEFRCLSEPRVVVRGWYWAYVVPYGVAYTPYYRLTETTGHPT